MSPFAWLPAWQAKDFEVEKVELVYNGFYQVHALQLRHRCFSGEWSHWLVREQIQHSDAAAVLLFDPEQNKVVLIEQFRVGLAGRDTNQSPWILEIVAGLLEPGEHPDDTVIREAKEEAHCQIIKLIKIMDFYNTPGGFTEKTSLYCGLVDARGIGGVAGISAEHEDIYVHVLPFDSVLAALEKGQWMSSASTVIALQWLKENKDKI